MVRKKVLVWQSHMLVNRQYRGFTMTSLLAVILILAGIQTWQMYAYRSQMDIYGNIIQAYRLDIVTNEVKMLRLQNPNQSKFMISNIYIYIDDGNINFKLKDGTIIKRKFLMPQ